MRVGRRAGGQVAELASAAGPVAEVAEVAAAGWPVLVSLPDLDGAGSLATAALAAWAGARVFRVRRVRETRRVLRMVSAICGDIPPAYAVRGLALTTRKEHPPIGLFHDQIMARKGRIRSKTGHDHGWCPVCLNVELRHTGT